MKEKRIAAKRQCDVARRQRSDRIPELRIVVVVVEPLVEHPVIGVKALALNLPPLEARRSCAYAEETQARTARKAAAARPGLDRNIPIFGLRLRWMGR